MSNVYATAEAWQRSLFWLVLAAVLTLPAPAMARRQDDDRKASGIATAGHFLVGAAAGLGAHETGHLLFDVVFDADPGLKRVEFGGLPFFAITHRPDVSPRRAFTIASAGFWVQHAGNEWLLTKRPWLRHERAPLVKGLLAFNLLASTGYAAVAFTTSGPPERDTRGMAASARIDERWVGALILAPAVLDGWRYFDPEAKWPVWLSRAVKIGGVLLVLRK